jgi:hypothetical protein
LFQQCCSQQIRKHLPQRKRRSKLQQGRNNRKTRTLLPRMTGIITNTATRNAIIGSSSIAGRPVKTSWEAGRGRIFRLLPGIMDIVTLKQDRKNRPRND